MIRREGSRMALGGPVTLSNVAEVLEEGRRHLADGVRTVDLAGVSELDSSLVAALLLWLRDASARGEKLAFTGVPESLRTLSGLYGVEALLPVER